MKPLATMTVGELREYLAKFPASKPVCFAYPSGDHWHTQLVGTINSAELARARWTDYHNAYEVAEQGEEILLLGE